jgi:hypothetical protein
LAAALLEQAGISTENRLAQVLRGRDWARQYSWERTADLTAQALRARFGLDQFFVHGAAHG